MRTIIVICSLWIVKAINLDVWKNLIDDWNNIFFVIMIFLVDVFMTFNKFFNER